MAQTKQQREEAKRLEDARAVLDAHRAEEEAAASKAEEVRAAAAIVEEAEEEARRKEAASARIQAWLDRARAVNWTDADQAALDGISTARRKQRELMQLRIEARELNVAGDVPPEWEKKLLALAEADAAGDLYKVAAEAVGSAGKTGGGNPYNLPTYEELARQMQADAPTMSTRKVTNRGEELGEEPATWEEICNRAKSELESLEDNIRQAEERAENLAKLAWTTDDEFAFQNYAEAKQRHERLTIHALVAPWHFKNKPITETQRDLRARVLGELLDKLEAASSNVEGYWRDRFDKELTRARDQIAQEIKQGW